MSTKLLLLQVQSDSHKDLTIFIRIKMRDLHSSKGFTNVQMPYSNIKYEHV